MRSSLSRRGARTTAVTSPTARSDAGASHDHPSHEEDFDTDDAAETDFWELAPMPPASNHLAGASLPEAVQQAMTFLRTTIRRSATLDRVRHSPDTLDESTKVALRMIRNAAGAKYPQTYSTSDFHQVTGAAILLRAANCTEAALLAGRWLVEQGAATHVKLVACIGKDEKSREIDHVLLHLGGWTTDRTTVAPFFFDPFMGLLSEAEQRDHFGSVSTRQSLGNDAVLFPQTPAGARTNMQVYAADASGKGYISPYARAVNFDNVLVGEISRGADGRAIYNRDPLMFGDRRPPRRTVQHVPAAAPSPAAAAPADRLAAPESASTGSSAASSPAGRGAWPYALAATAAAAIVAAAAASYTAFAGS